MTENSLTADNPNRTAVLFSKNNLANILILFGLFTVFVLGIYLRLESLDVVRVVDFFIRDVERAFNIIEGNFMPLAGPELNNGGRLPGPFMYILLAIPLLIHPSYESIFIFNFILNVASIPLLYFFLQKRFGIGFSAVATAFYALSLHNIEAVMFPMNPSFIFPISVLYLGALLSFVNSKHPKYLLWILLTILLGIQFHFSIASYSVTPILLIFLFRMKIPAKTILIGLLIAGICFLPYIIHKKIEFSPKGAGVSIKRELDTSFIGLFKIITVQNTILRLATSKPFEKENPSKNMQDLFLGSFSIAFYSLFFFIAYKIRKQGLHSCTKEITIVSSFYFPAIIYEIINPWKLHFWYQNIFILPKALVISLFIYSIFKSKNIFLKNSFALGTVAIVIYLQIISFKLINKEVNFLNEQLYIHVNPSGSYKNSKILLNTLMTKLDLSPKEFFDRVYLLNFYPSGYRRLAFAYGQKSVAENNIQSKKMKSCYFIMSTHFSVSNKISQSSQRNRYKIFNRDNTIKIIKKHMISLKDKGFPVDFMVSEYIPNQNQSCYSNSFNQFVITKDIRDLLIQSKSLSKKLSNANPFGTVVKTISEEETYDRTDELESFYGEYVIQNGLTQTPFKFILTIKKFNKTYSLRGEVKSYYFFGSPSFNMQSMNLTITPIELIDKTASTYARAQVASRYNTRHKSGFIFNILSDNTLVTADALNIMSNNALWNYNRDWYREIESPKNLKFKRNKFFIDLDWTINWRDGQFCCYTELPQTNILNLKKIKND